MAGPGRTSSSVRIRSRISLADAALVRLEARMAKGGKVAAETPDHDATPVSPAAPQPAPVAAEAVPDKSLADIAAELEAALKDHLESVASALAADELNVEPEPQPAPPPAPVQRSRPAMPPAAPLPKNEPPAPMAKRAPAPPPAKSASPAASPTKGAELRSIYAPDPGLKADRIDLRLPRVAPLEIDPLPSMLTAPPPHADRREFEDKVRAADEGLPSPERDGRERSRSAKSARPLDHFPPMVDRPSGVSARTLAVAALFGLAAGIGAIVAYQFAVAPTPALIVATAPILPMNDTTRIAKIEADRVPQGSGTPVARVAASGAAPAQAVADAGAPPAAFDPPAPSASAAPIAIASDAPVVADATPRAAAAEVPIVPAPSPFTMRPSEEPGSAKPAPAVASAPLFEVPASAKPAPGDPPALAYAPPSEPSDPVAKSFFGKGDDASAADSPPPKKPASAKGAGVAMGKARVTSHVNMRARPDNGAPAVKVLAAGSTVQVVRCDFWCEVVSDGKHGYVFRRFLAN